MSGGGTSEAPATLSAISGPPALVNNRFTFPTLGLIRLDLSARAVRATEPALGNHSRPRRVGNGCAPANRRVHGSRPCDLASHLSRSSRSFCLRSCAALRPRRRRAVLRLVRRRQQRQELRSPELVVRAATTAGPASASSSMPPQSNAYTDPYAASGEQPQGSARSRHRGGTGRSVAYCVRLCDGRYFPMQRRATRPPSSSASLLPGREDAGVQRLQDRPRGRRQRRALCRSRQRVRLSREDRSRLHLQRQGPVRPCTDRRREPIRRCEPGDIVATGDNVKAGDRHAAPQGTRDVTPIEHGDERAQRAVAAVRAAAPRKTRRRHRPRRQAADAPAEPKPPED